jgi:hypothetical protein
MNQIFHHYELWEDYQKGMYYISKERDTEGLIQSAKKLLCNPPILEREMRRVINEWPIATEVNLTNLGQNRRAWLGQAACCISEKVPEILTRLAWNGMTEVQQAIANNVADKIILGYELRITNNAQEELSL